MALGEDLPVGIWVARAPGGELVYANRTFDQILGMGARDDVQVGQYGPIYGICKADGHMVRKNEKARLVLSVDLIGQAVSVEVDAADVRPA